MRSFGRKGFRGAGDFAEVDPFDVGVVIGDGAVGKARRVVLDVAGFVDVFEFVGQAVEIAEDLAEHAAADFVFEDVGGEDDFLLGAATRVALRGRRGRGSAQRRGAMWFIARLSVGDKGGVKATVANGTSPRRIQ